jgi:AhpD family alkylhydroperoxidase
MLGRLGRAIRTRTVLPGHTADLAGLVVSQDNSCRFCYAYQRAVMRTFGFPEERIEQLEQGFARADITPKERAALDFARKVSRSDPLPGEIDKRPLRDTGYTELEIVELAGLAGLFVFHTRISTVPALPLGQIETMPDQWYMKLLRPLMSLYMRTLYQQSAGEPIAPEQAAGPFADVVMAFDGLRLAHDLRYAIDVALEESALPSRSKLLLFAVVARALGCSLTEAETVRLLAKEHGMDASVTQNVLAHLTAPELDETESLIVPFARDTVWYNQATPIQQRARELRDEMKLEPFLEMVGAVAVANMVCRLGIAVPGGAHE